MEIIVSMSQDIEFLVKLCEAQIRIEVHLRTQVEEVKKENKLNKKLKLLLSKSVN